MESVISDLLISPLRDKVDFIYDLSGFDEYIQQYKLLSS